MKQTPPLGQRGFDFLLPGILYAVIFCVLTYPAVFFFRSHVMTDMGDGPLNLWDFWWVHKALVILHQTPFYTTFLHFPYGTSLTGHSLNVLDSFIAAALHPWLSWRHAYNVILMGAFVLTGWTTYALARRLDVAQDGSLLAGAVVTFSNYHFAHAEGHLELVSFQWVPLFLLFCVAGLRHPKRCFGVGAALSLFLILLGNYYYTLFALLSAMILLWQALSGKGRSISWHSLLPEFGIFVLLSGLLCGPMVLKMLRMASAGRSGGHPADSYSLDLIAPFVPGGHWRFAFLTRPLWARWCGNIHENSVYLGWSVLALVFYAWRHRKNPGMPPLGAWYAMMIFFFCMALGPYLQVGGIRFPFIPLPYVLLENIIPWIRVSGCPVRMMSIVILACGIAAGAGFSHWRARHPSPLFLGAFFLMLGIEYWPKPLPMNRLDAPGYIQALVAAPPGAIVDAISPPGLMLYYQTLHEKPLGLGHLSRIPPDVRLQDEALVRLYQQGEFRTLHERYGFRYFVLPATPQIRSLCRNSTSLFDDGHTMVRDFQR